jgi:stage III sporulation protein AD
MTSATIFSLIGLALVATITALLLKESRLGTLALLVALAGGALIILRLLPSLSTLLEGYQALGTVSGVSSYYFGLILKIIGIAYICEFCAQLCRDAAQTALALKIELAAKVGILILALPVLSSIVKTVIGLF